MSSKTETRPTAEYIRFKRIVLANTDNNSTTSDSVVDAVEFNDVGGTDVAIMSDPVADAVEFNDVGGTNILYKNFYITLILISF